MTVSEILKRIDEIMTDVEDKDFDVSCIMEDIGGVTREKAALYPDEDIADSVAVKVIAAAHKRACGYPLQYILGQWEFYGLPFKVGEGVLIPRPDTEALVEAVLDRLNKTGRDKLAIVDLCSGSGCIAVALSKQLGDKAQLYAVELSGEAFPYMVENVRMNNANVKLLRGDVMNGSIMDNFRDPDENGEYIPIDCIVSNPPYLTDREMAELQTEVRAEPENALYGGSDGLKFYRVIICLWKELLREGGLLAFEIGTQQAEAVRDMLEDGGFRDIFTENDATGGIRVIGGYKAAAV